MNRTYASFADFCMLSSGGQPWALDMRSRSGNPALFTYVVNGVAHLLSGHSAIQERFRRTADGVMVADSANAAEFAPTSMVMLALRFAKGRLLHEGVWRNDLQQVIESSCPELQFSKVGETIEASAAGHWALSLSSGLWIPSVERAQEMGVDYARI